MEKKRVEYIDALRGFTMLLVILAHINTFSYSPHSSDSPILVLQLFRMPLFFFISGYIAYKSNIVWDYTKWKRNIIRKIQVQLIPTVCIGMIYTYIILHENWFDFISDSEKNGYWFTLALLGIFLIYYTYLWITKGKHSKGLLLLVLVCYGLTLICSHSIVELKKISDYLCINLITWHFQYFIFGIFAAKYKESFFRLLEHRLWTTFFILVFLCCAYLKCELFSLQLNYSTTKVLFHLMRICGAYSGIMIVYSCFRRNKDIFSSSTKIGYWLQYVGRRTLDIYLLHYFFLPTLPFLGKFFCHYNNLVLEIFVGLTISILITICCLIISNILRLSPILSQWIFGVKNINTQNNIK